MPDLSTTCHPINGQGLYRPWCAPPTLHCGSLFSLCVWGGSLFSFLRQSNHFWIRPPNNAAQKTQVRNLWRGLKANPVWHLRTGAQAFSMWRVRNNFRISALKNVARLTKWHCLRSNENRHVLYHACQVHRNYVFQVCLLSKIEDPNIPAFSNLRIRHVVPDLRIRRSMYREGTGFRPTALWCPASLSNEWRHGIMFASSTQHKRMHCTHTHMYYYACCN